MEARSARVSTPPRINPIEPFAGPVPLGSTPALDAHAPAAFPAWGLRHVLLALAIVVASLFASTLFVGLAASGLHLFAHRTPVQLGHEPLLAVPMEALAYAITLALLRLMLVPLARQPFGEALHWRARRALALFGRLALLGVGLQLVAALVALKLPMPKSVPMDQYFNSTAGVWVLAVFGVLVAPPCEEIFFRGLLYPALRRHLGTAAAVVLTALPFALMHAAQIGNAWAPLLVLFAVGLVLTLVRVRTDSVAASSLVHVFYNLTIFTQLAWATGGFRHLERISQP